MSARRRHHTTHAPYPRIARVNELLREVLAERIERLSDVDDRLGLLTVTGIETSADLTRAVVYLGALDEASVQVLEEHRAELQRAIGREARLKRTPLLEFTADPAVLHAMRVEEVLRRVSAGRSERSDRTEDRTDDRTGEDDGG